MTFKALLAGLAALSLTASASRKPRRHAPEFSADAFRAHVTFLADDLLEGRETGSRGYDIAARYVATQFQALGLQPGDGDGSWLQPIEFVRYRAAGRRPSAVGGRSLHPGPRNRDAGRARDGAAEARSAAGVRRLRARHAGARLRRLSRARRARKDRRRAERAPDAARRATSPPI